MFKWLYNDVGKIVKTLIIFTKINNFVMFKWIKNQQKKKKDNTIIVIDTKRERHVVDIRDVFPTEVDFLTFELIAAVKLFEIATIAVGCFYIFFFATN